MYQKVLGVTIPKHASFGICTTQPQEWLTLNPHEWGKK